MPDHTELLPQQFNANRNATLFDTRFVGRFIVFAARICGCARNERSAIERFSEIDFGFDHRFAYAGHVERLFGPDDQPESTTGFAAHAIHLLGRTRAEQSAVDRN